MLQLQPVLEEYKLTTDELIIHDNSHHDELTIQDTSCRNVVSHPDDHDNSQYYSFEDSALHCDDTFDEIEVDSNIVSDCVSFFLNKLTLLTSMVDYTMQMYNRHFIL